MTLITRNEHDRSRQECADDHRPGHHFSEDVVLGGVDEDTRGCRKGSVEEGKVGQLVRLRLVCAGVKKTKKKR